MECHAYLCPKRKVAQSVCLTVAQAFNTAYELWKLVQLDSRIYHAQDKSPTTADEQKGELYMYIRIYTYSISVYIDVWVWVESDDASGRGRKNARHGGRLDAVWMRNGSGFLRAT